MTERLLLNFFDIKHSIKDYISDNRLNEGLKLLTNFLESVDIKNSDLLNVIVMLTSEYKRIKTEMIKGSMEIQQTNIMMNSIISRLLTFLDDLEEGIKKGTIIIDESNDDVNNEAIVKELLEKNIIENLRSSVDSDELIQTLKTSIEDKLMILDKRRQGIFSFLRIREEEREKIIRELRILEQKLDYEQAFFVKNTISFKENKYKELIITVYKVMSFCPKEVFDFYEQMKKNIENLGKILDEYK